MQKTLKILGITVAALLGLVIAAAVALSMLFDPNQYKPEIIKLVKDQTGRDLKIEKKIGWSFFPRLGVEAGGLELSNASGFGKEPFATIDAAGVQVAVLPLLTGRIELGRVYLHGLQLNLAKNPAGRNNWEDMASSSPAPAKPAEPGTGKLPVEGIAVGGLEIRRSGLAWNDLQSGSRMAVRNLELTTGRFVANRPVDLKLGFEFARDRATPIKAALASQLTVSPDMLKLAEVDLKVDDSRLRGSIEVRNLAKPALRFDLALDRIDLDRYLGGGEPAAPGKTAAGPKGQAAAPPAGIPLAMLRSLDIDGKFQAGALKAFGLHTTEARIRVNAKNGVIKLGPNSARLYQGGYRGETGLDARGKALQLALNEKLEGVQVGPLLKDMKMFDHYTGTGNIALKLTATGVDAAQLRRTLNGKANIAFRDGSIEGVDLLKLIEQARALSDMAKGKPVTVNPKQSDATVFKSLTASILVTNGIARNEDLVLDGANLRATGRGNADLMREMLDYKLKVTVAEATDKRGTTVPVLVRGTFAKPTFDVDFGEIIKQQAEKELKKQLEKGIDQLFQPKKSRKQKLLEQQQQAPK